MASDVLTEATKGVECLLNQACKLLAREVVEARLEFA